MKIYQGERVFATVQGILVVGYYIESTIVQIVEFPEHPKFHTIKLDNGVSISKNTKYYVDPNTMHSMEEIT